MRGSASSSRLVSWRSERVDDLCQWERNFAQILFNEREVVTKRIGVVERDEPAADILRLQAFKGSQGFEFVFGGGRFEFSEIMVRESIGAGQERSLGVIGIGESFLDKLNEIGRKLGALTIRLFGELGLQPSEKTGMQNTGNIFVLACGDRK